MKQLVTRSAVVFFAVHEHVAVPGLTINGVGSCGHAEELGSGTPPSNYIRLSYNPNNPRQTVQSGWQAVEYDMIVDSQNKCVTHHGQ